MSYQNALKLQVGNSVTVKSTQEAATITGLDKYENVVFIHCDNIIYTHREIE